MMGQQDVREGCAMASAELIGTIGLEIGSRVGGRKLAFLRTESQTAASVATQTTIQFAVVLHSGHRKSSGSDFRRNNAIS